MYASGGEEVRAMSLQDSVMRKVLRQNNYDKFTEILHNYITGSQGVKEFYCRQEFLSTLRGGSLVVHLWCLFKEFLHSAEEVKAALVINNILKEKFRISYGKSHFSPSL